jgi:hypothetical protein
MRDHENISTDTARRHLAAAAIRGLCAGAMHATLAWLLSIFEHS